jgi:2-polyprenyl-6-methoxyphenol hydroxylase-like FAD-dependent oxidoreductase
VTQVDVLICGAGPAGCATALALRQAGIAQVGLVDWPIKRPWAIGESATPDVGTMLARLGLAGALDGHARYEGNLSLWGGWREIDDFLHRGRGHGWHLDREAFDAMLRQAVVERGVHVARPAKIEQLAWQREAWTLRIVGHGEWRARLLVDATGRRAELASRLGARQRRVDGLVALGVVVPSRAPRELAGLSLIEPFEHGWWYAAPQSDDRAVVCLMTDRDLARQASYREEQWFRRAWCETLELARRLPPPEAPIEIATFPAHCAYLDRAAGLGWLAVGDALMSFDPLSSSGISGALADGLAAADTLLQWLHDPGSMALAARAWARRANATWRRFLDQRRRHYAAETRWPASPFWAARRQPIEMPLARAETPSRGETCALEP